MRWIVAALILIGLVVAWMNRRIWLVSYIVIFVAVAVTGLVDFYLWGYDYGHNLDPNAAIIVPGMAYQPPLIGTKQLLNFTAYSGPDIGGYILLVSGLVAVATLIVELRTSAKKKIVQVAGIILTMFCFACSAEPEPLNYGRDACHFCKMTLMDKRFGGEIVTSKGKVFKFDDLNCMINFIDSKEVPLNEIKHELIVNYSAPATLINASSAFFIHSPEIKSPMNGNYAAFSDNNEATRKAATWNGRRLTWSDLKK